MTEAERIGRRLRQLRERRRLTQGQVARRMRTHRPIVGRIERGLHTVDLRTLARYVAAVRARLIDVTVVLDTHPDWDIERGCWRGAA